MTWRKAMSCIVVVWTFLKLNHLNERKPPLFRVVLPAKAHVIQCCVHAYTYKTELSKWLPDLILTVLRNPSPGRVPPLSWLWWDKEAVWWQGSHKWLFGWSYVTDTKRGHRKEMSHWAVDRKQNKKQKCGMWPWICVSKIYAVTRFDGDPHPSGY